MTHVIPPGATFELPALPRQLATGRHPAIDRLEPLHDQWMRQNYPFPTENALSAFLSQRSALWTAVTYPATDEARFHDLSRLTSFLFAFDDLFLRKGPNAAADVKRIFTDMLTVLDGGTATTAYGTALADIWHDMAGRMPARQRHRLRTATEDFGRGCFTEMPSRAPDAILDLTSYTTLRLEQSLAAWVYFILTEYAAGVDLPDDTLTQLRPVHWACAEHLLFSNDLFSFRTEHFAGDHVNAVCVLLADGATLQQAINQVADLISDKEQQVTDMLTAVRASGLGADRYTTAYLHHLEYVISGNLEQARFAPRYHGTSGFIHQPIDRGTVTLHADRTGHLSLPGAAVQAPPSG
ncbi:terpene synthase family protein [Streptomyces sp. NPDC002773]|uniref:terpene synthase family protein n=1 Tax=Streptomyces sp. NPDC002773 TaxID=3154430 RepID=UPI00332009F9